MRSESGDIASQLTFGFTTIDRRETAFEAVRVIRRDFPNCPIMVVDQNDPTPEAIEFYGDNGVTTHFVEYDIGLSAARNLMFAECQTPYFFMLDDDVVEIPRSEILDSLAVIRSDDRILVVGGRASKIVKQPNGSEKRQINPPFNYFLDRRPNANFALFFDPSLFPGIKPPKYDKFVNYKVTEIVENFGVFSLEKYNDLNLSWDSEIKIGAEHTDFYLSVKQASTGDSETLIVSNPKLIAYDIDAITAPNMEDYRKKRYRHSFRSIYSKKWNIRAEMHLAKWLNIYTEDGHRTVKWDDLSEFGEKQKALYNLEGQENIRRHSHYPIGDRRVSFIATTVDRFDAIQALTLSIRARYGFSVDIVLGIQCNQLPDGFQRFADETGARLVPMDFDIGLSAARNKIVEQIDTEYFVLCDDDFVIDENFHIGNAMRLLDDEPNVTGVGGYYRDIIYDQEMRLKHRAERHFTFQASYESKTSTLIRTPFYHLPVGSCYERDRGGMSADILQNIALFRTSEFGPDALHWDERMKISGEHLDFYVKNLLVDKKQFVFDPGFSVLHNRVQNTVYRKLRSRNDGIMLFYEKWGVKFEIDTELGFRSTGGDIAPWQAFPE